MAHDSLETLLRVRKMARDAARQELTAAEQAELQARHALDAAEANIQREMRAASRLECDDQTVETFALWLASANSQLAQAVCTHDTAEATLVQTRASFTLARQAVEIIETAIAERQAAARNEAQRREQLRLDEIQPTRSDET